MKEQILAMATLALMAAPVAAQTAGAGNQHGQQSAAAADTNGQTDESLGSIGPDYGKTAKEIAEEKRLKQVDDLVFSPAAMATVAVLLAGGGALAILRKRRTI